MPSRTDEGMATLVRELWRRQALHFDDGWKLEDVPADMNAF